MQSFMLGSYLTLSCVVIVATILVVIQSWEHQRFAKGRLSQVAWYHCSGRVMLIIPCCGKDCGLKGNLRTFFQQDYDNYLIRFVVESENDLAYPIIRQLIDDYPHVEAEVIIAGQAKTSGQKIHNLLAATAIIPSDVEYLAFADSDARLRCQWLKALLIRLHKAGVAAATGYRWFLPLRQTYANHLLYSLNCQIAIFYGKHSPTVVWGGSWALRRELFESLGMQNAWKGKVSDDLVASQIIRKAGLRVVFEPACMIISPIDTSFCGIFSFLRRQYFFSRSSNRYWWAVILTISLFSVFVFWGNLVVAILAMVGAPWSVWLPASICCVLYCLFLIAGLFRTKASIVYFPQLRHRLQRACWIDILAGPVGLLVHGIGQIMSFLSRRITWRGITYRLDAEGRVVSICRQSAE